jgi:hypothetical protein
MAPNAPASQERRVRFDMRGILMAQCGEAIADYAAQRSLL